MTRNDAVRCLPTASFPAKWAPYLQSLARIIFGFLVLRHGMEQVLGVSGSERRGAAVVRRHPRADRVSCRALDHARPLHAAGGPRPLGDVLHHVFRRPAPARPVHAPERRRSDPPELLLLPLSGRGRRRRLEPGPAAPCRPARPRPIPDGRRTRWGFFASGPAACSSCTAWRSFSASAAGASTATS